MRLPVSPSGQMVRSTSDWRRLHEPATARRSRDGRIATCGILGEKSGGQGRDRTGVRGFAGRCMTTLPPGQTAAGALGFPLKRRNPGDPRLRFESGAGNETRTRDPDLGKVVLYQLSYSRKRLPSIAEDAIVSTLWAKFYVRCGKICGSGMRSARGHGRDLVPRVRCAYPGYVQRIAAMGAPTTATQHHPTPCPRRSRQSSARRRAGTGPWTTG